MQAFYLRRRCTAVAERGKIKKRYQQKWSKEEWLKSKKVKNRAQWAILLRFTSSNNPLKFHFIAIYSVLHFLLSMSVKHHKITKSSNKHMKIMIFLFYRQTSVLSSRTININYLRQTNLQMKYMDSMSLELLIRLRISSFSFNQL